MQAIKLSLSLASHIKKRFLYEERRDDLREEYQKILNRIPKPNLVYLDESGFDLNMKKECGWKMRGQRLYMIIKAVIEKTKELPLFLLTQIKQKD